MTEHWEWDKMPSPVIPKILDSIVVNFFFAFNCYYFIIAKTTEIIRLVDLLRIFINLLATFRENLVDYFFKSMPKSMAQKISKFDPEHI